MIHAMMSDRTSRPSRSEYLPCEPQSGESVALAEARRVLAVAEPRTTAWSDDGMIDMPSCHGYTAVYAQLAVHGVADVGAILAEALSSFLAAPDPAAYLASLQEQDQEQDEQPYVSLAEQRRRNKQRAKAAFLGPGYAAYLAEVAR